MARARPPETDHPVIVLGAGIVGICTALSLVERGVPVRVIDRGPPGQETSMGNAGVISPWSFIPQALPGVWKTIPKMMIGYGRPLSIHPATFAKMFPWGIRFLRQATEQKLRASAEAMEFLCGPSTDLYYQHLQGMGHEHLVRDSMYIHAFRDGRRATLQAIDYRIRSEKGADLELVGRDRLNTLEPALSKVFQAAVLIKGQSRALSPGKIGEALAAKASGLGATFVTDDVQSLRRDDGSWRILGLHETYKADQIVISMGAWSASLLEHIGLKLRLMAERGYHIECENPGIELENSIMDVDAKVVASSMEGGLRVAGLAEFSPIDAPPNERRKLQLKRIAQAAFPELRVGEPRFWMGRRPSFPDSLPVLGTVPDIEGLFVNFGHSHYGLMMAPKSGEVLADLVAGGRPNRDLGAYSVSRFAQKLE